MACLQQGREKLLAELPHDATAEGRCLGYSNSLICEKIVDCVSQIADRHSFGVSRVVYTTLVAKPPFLIQQKHMRGANGPVGSGNRPILILDVWKVETLLPKSQDHFSVGVSRREIRVVRVQSQQLDIFRRVVLLDPSHTVLASFHGRATI